jgi:hypothetical protein
VIEFRSTQPVNGGQCRVARVKQHAHKAPDGGRVTRQWLDSIGG